MPTDLTALTELIILCGHATFTGSGRADITSEASWLLQPFQRSNPLTGKRSEHETFISHILTATFAAASRPQALLIFSGGRTTTASSRTEAQGYEAVHLGLGDPFDIEERYAREDWATDSLQNLLFSILRFRQMVGVYPKEVTVVTHAFKRERVLGAHARALRWPEGGIRVVGVDPPFTEREFEEAREGERGAREAFERDKYGRLEPLAGKRRVRGFEPDKVERFFADVECEARELLRYSSRDDEGLTLPERFPWEEREGAGE